MNAFSELKDAALGWLDLLAGRAAGAERFGFTMRGLINAVGFYLAVIVLQLALGEATAGGPGWVVVNLLVNLIPAVLVGGLSWGTMRLMRPQVSPLRLLVPSLYALGFMSLLLLVLTPLGLPGLTIAVLGALGFLLFRGARLAGGLGRGIAVAFGVLCVLALVVLTFGLYMLVANG